MAVSNYQNVIVGGGLAGGMIAQEYREQGGDGSIVMIASEPHYPYHRPPLTKDFLRGELTDQFTAIVGEMVRRAK